MPYLPSSCAQKPIGSREQYAQKPIKPLRGPAPRAVLFYYILLKIFKSGFQLTILSYRACLQYQIYFTNIPKLLSLVNCQKNWTKIHFRILLDLVTFPILFEFWYKTNYKNDNFVFWITGKHYTLKDLIFKVLELDRFLSRFLNLVLVFPDKFASASVYL